MENHPEIRAVWLTKNEEIYQQLTEEGKPVVMTQTAQCRKLVSRAAIAVTDHFKMSDYDVFSGLNDNLKMVQLWHGDEEFPPRLRFLWDENPTRYIRYETTWYAAGLLLSEIKSKMKCALECGQ